jgi:hypothetical protein
VKPSVHGAGGLSHGQRAALPDAVAAPRSNASRQSTPKHAAGLSPPRTRPRMPRRARRGPGDHPRRPQDLSRHRARSCACLSTATASKTSRHRSTTRSARLLAQTILCQGIGPRTAMTGSSGGPGFQHRPKMRMRGLEPPRPYGHGDLNAARLPVPPQPRGRGQFTGLRPRRRPAPQAAAPNSESLESPSLAAIV